MGPGRVCREWPSPTSQHSIYLVGRMQQSPESIPQSQQSSIQDASPVQSRSNRPAQCNPLPPIRFPSHRIPARTIPSHAVAVYYVLSAGWLSYPRRACPDLSCYPIAIACLRLPSSLSLSKALVLPVLPDGVYAHTPRLSPAPCPRLLPCTLLPFTTTSAPAHSHQVAAVEVSFPETHHTLYRTPPHLTYTHYFYTHAQGRRVYTARGTLPDLTFLHASASHCRSPPPWLTLLLHSVVPFFFSSNLSPKFLVVFRTSEPVLSYEKRQTTHPPPVSFSPRPL